jgi:hypothetical protein
MIITLRLMKIELQILIWVVFANIIWTTENLKTARLIVSRLCAP